MPCLRPAVDLNVKRPGSALVERLCVFHVGFEPDLIEGNEACRAEYTLGLDKGDLLSCGVVLR